MKLFSFSRSVLTGAVSLLRTAVFFGINMDIFREKQGIPRGINESEKKVKSLTLSYEVCICIMFGFFCFLNGTVILRSQGCVTVILRSQGCMTHLQGPE